MATKKPEEEQMKIPSPEFLVIPVIARTSASKGLTNKLRFDQARVVESDTKTNAASKAKFPTATTEVEYLVVALTGAMVVTLKPQIETHTRPYKSYREL
jgi:hypothetical protein